MTVVAGLPVHMFIRDARAGEPETIARVVREIEEMGFWGVSVSHHLSDPGLSALGHAGGELVNWRYADPIAILSYLAAVSKKVRLIPWVMVLPYRRPVELAHGLATIDSLSGGRLVFGAGAGSQESEFRLVGASRKERGRITDEWLDVVIELWTNPKATYSGRYTDFENVNLAVKPVQKPRPPFVIGGKGEKRLLRAAARWADHYNYPGDDVSDFRYRLQVLHDHCVDIDRDPSQIETSLQIRVSDVPGAIAKAAEAGAAGADHVIFYLPPPADIRLIEPVAEEAKRSLG